MKNIGKNSSIPCYFI